MSITQNVVIIVYHQAKNQKAQACVSGYAEMLNITVECEKIVKLLGTWNVLKTQTALNNVLFVLK